MTGNSNLTEPNLNGVEENRAAFVDADDAPELDDAFFEQADLHVAGVLVARGRPRLAAPKQVVNIRLSPDVLAAFKADGPGWQTRINEALREWLAGPKSSGGRLTPSQSGASIR